MTDLQVSQSSRCSVFITRPTPDNHLTPASESGPAQLGLVTQTNIIPRLLPQSPVSEQRAYLTLTRAGARSRHKAQHTCRAPATVTPRYEQRLCCSFQMSRLFPTHHEQLDKKFKFSLDLIRMILRFCV